MMRSTTEGARRGVACALLVVVAGCQWQRVGSNPGPDPAVVVPQLFDAAGVYAGMGFFAKGPPLPFVAQLRYLASGSPDSTLTLFGLSLANNALSFRRAGDGFEARYRAELVVRREGTILQRVTSEETVRVGSREEALRADESVIFQQMLRLGPGAYTAAVSLRDEFTGTLARDERAIVVPGLGAGRLSDLVPVYQVEPRTALDDPLRVLANPRATVPFGTDTLRFYLEAYGVPAGTRVAVSVFRRDREEVWSGEFRLMGSPLGAAVVTLVPDHLPVGQLRVVARVPADSSTGLALVSFSDQWAITNFEDVLALLRYFGQDRAIGRMRAAPEPERPALWREFVRATDPNPATPENEALEQYFRRVQVANARFGEAGEPGWLSDRGEVFISLGEPDEIFDLSSEFQGPRRIIRWNYFSHRLALDFVDETGFGRFRLTPSGRAEFQRLVNSLRSRS